MQNAVQAKAASNAILASDVHGLMPRSHLLLCVCKPLCGLEKQIRDLLRITPLFTLALGVTN